MRQNIHELRLDNGKMFEPTFNVEVMFVDVDVVPLTCFTYCGSVHKIGRIQDGSTSEQILPSASFHFKETFNQTLHFEDGYLLIDIVPPIIY